MEVHRWMSIRSMECWLAMLNASSAIMSHALEQINTNKSYSNRSHLPKCFIKALHFLLAWLLCFFMLVLRGWAIHAPTWIAWVRMLASLPRDIPQHHWVDVFTDGSCFWQAQPSLRVAAWSAVIRALCLLLGLFEVEGLLGAS